MRISFPYIGFRTSYIWEQIVYMIFCCLINVCHPAPSPFVIPPFLFVFPYLYIFLIIGQPHCCIVMPFLVIVAFSLGVNYLGNVKFYLVFFCWKFFQRMCSLLQQKVYLSEPLIKAYPNPLKCESLNDF